MNCRLVVGACAALSMMVSVAHAEKMSPKQHQALQLKIIAKLNTKGPQFDACTKRFLEEYPKANGAVTLSMKISPEGKVVSAQAVTALKGARNLRPCIESVGKSYTFEPTQAAEPAPLSVTIPVEDGAKFKLYPPGQEPKRPKEDKSAPAIFRFTPATWNPANSAPTTP